MPTLSYDGQSFMIDNRRVWIVAGSVCYAAVPRDLWRDRLLAAKQAGLNCIDVPIVWSLHEPSPKKPNFEGQGDVKHFIELASELGLWCIVRVGPYVGGGLDLGGMPPWLTTVSNIQLRQANGPFLEATSRHFTALMKQISDLQASKPIAKNSNEGGPILAFQIETDWFCHHEAQGQGYLRELSRYLRENGCNVPILEANNLWEPIDGTLSTWKADDHLAPDVRQLRVIQPSVPRVVTTSNGAGTDHFGGDHRTGHEPNEFESRLAQVFAVGAQLRIDPFHGGTRFGFSAGRLATAHDGFVTTSADGDAPLSEAGGRTDSYTAVKRIATFASQFGHVLAHVEPEAIHVSAAPTSDEHPLAIVHQRGPQGEVVFLLKDAKDKTKHVDLLLNDGRTLPVPLGEGRVSWVLLNANLGGVAALTYSNLCPWAFIGRKMLVVAGPAGARGLIGVDDTPIEVTVPDGKTPLVEQHEPITLVVLNDAMLDVAIAHDDGLLVGAASFDEPDKPYAASGYGKVIAVTPDGEVTKLEGEKIIRLVPPKLADWTHASTDAFTSGQANSFKKIDGPADLATLGVPTGYGWYKVTGKGAKSQAILLAEVHDRAHLFVEGQPTAIVGHGPGATDEPIDMAWPGELTVLADNCGRPNGGWQMDEAKGVFGHAFAVTPLKLTKPKVVDGVAPDPFTLGGFYVDLCESDEIAADTLVWKFKPIGRQSVVFEIRDLPLRCLVAVNDEPLGMYDPQQCGGLARWTWHTGEQIKGGQNELQLRLFDKYDKKVDAVKFVTLYQTSANLTSKSDWAFSPWTMPDDDAFADDAGSVAGRPCWHRTVFNVTHTAAPLWFEAKGLSKGQIYLNGHNVGRYFVAPPTGKSIGPQKHYYLPQPWLIVDGENVLTVFDEHGKSPDKCRLVYNANGPYGK